MTEQTLQHGSSTRTRTTVRSVIVRLGDQLFGVPVQDVLELILVGTATPVPQSNPYVRGVINLRGQILHLVDLRMLMGMPSLEEELVALQEMLQVREEDHRRWLEELERSVLEKRPFGLATDPHKCGFGLWYDNYKPSNLILSNHLEQFDGPHKRIHAIAQSVERLMKQDDQEQAMALIESTRDGDLSHMIHLFAQMRDLIWETQRESALVIRGANDQVTACSVDEIEAVDDLTLLAPDEAPQFGRGIAGTTIHKGEAALLLDLPDLLAE